MQEDDSSPRSTATVPDLVVIGASAGGVQTLKEVVSRLPADLDAAVCIVLHVAPTSPSALPGILGRAGPLPCRAARDGAPLVHGEILVAPPDHHLLIVDGRVSLTTGPRENNHRPAVDTLFRSAAERGGAVIGVILSGTMDDGTAGLAQIKARGGLAIVQDPADALYPGMPASALAAVSVDAVVPASEVAATITGMVNGTVSGTPAMSGLPDPPDDGSPVTICPECGGVLSEHEESGTLQWECRVGHRYSPASLLEAQGDDVEAALWAAIRVLEDRQILLTRMAAQLEARDQPRSARSLQRRADEALRHATLVREALAHATQTTLRSIALDDEVPAPEDAA